MTAYVRCGAFISGVADFDAEVFRVARTEAASMDPQHRLLQEATAYALADATVDGNAQTTGARIVSLCAFRGAVDSFTTRCTPHHLIRLEVQDWWKETIRDLVAPNTLKLVSPCRVELYIDMVAVCVAQASMWDA